MLLAGAMTATSAEAAPAAGIPEALKAAASQESDVAKVGWWDRYRSYRHRDRGDHHRWGNHRDHDRGHHRWGSHRDHDRGHHRWGGWRDHDRGHHWGRGRDHDRGHRWGRDRDHNRWGRWGGYGRS
jgi:hypothetical protein